MKALWTLTLCVVLISGLVGCASTDTATTKGDPVPGETKSTEESRLQPGAGMGPNASVRW